MDSLDKMLLFELSRSCRCPYSTLSQRLNIPVEEVGTRIQRLVRDRIILKFTVVPVPALFGAREAILFFRSRQSLDVGNVNSLGIHPTVEFISVGTNNEGFAFVHYRTESELTSVMKYIQNVNPKIDEIIAHHVHPLLLEERFEPEKDISAFQDVDWRILIHLREQGRLALKELSVRTNIEMETLVERLEFLRANKLIKETIHVNPAKTRKDTWTIFHLYLTILTGPLLGELERELESIQSYWRSSCWKVEEKSILLLGFLCSSYNEVEKIQTYLSEIPGLKSLEKTMGGVTYYFPDFRDELLEEKRSETWFAPERWVVDSNG